MNWSARLQVFVAIAVAASLASVACESTTDPSIQDGYELDGSGFLGQPHLLVSSKVAVGRTIDPIVELNDAESLVARNSARFKSSNARAMVVNANGTLTATGTGNTVISVNLDGLYDEVPVTVIPGLVPTFLTTTPDIEVRQVNDEGDYVGSSFSRGTILVRNGTETPIPNCAATGMNNRGDVACEIPLAACPGTFDWTTTPGVFSNGVLTPLFPGVHGWITGMNDSGQVLGTLIDCPTDSTPTMSEYFYGKPGALQRVLLPDGVSTATLNDNGFGIINTAGIGYVLDATRRIPLEASGPGQSVVGVDINDHNDVIGFSGSMRVWSGSAMPSATALAGTTWPGRTLTNSQCTPLHRFTDAEVIIGTGPPVCASELEGGYRIISAMIAPSVDSTWLVTPDLGFAVSRNGTIAMMALADGGVQAVAIIRP